MPKKKPTSGEAYCVCLRKAKLHKDDVPVELSLIVDQGRDERLVETYYLCHKCGGIFEPSDRDDSV